MLTLQTARRAAALIFAILGCSGLFHATRSPDPFNILILIYYAVMAGLFVRQPRTRQLDRSPRSLAISLIHAGLPLGLATPAQVTHLSVLGLVLMIVGLAFSLLSLVDLGSSFGLLPANHGIVDRGAYRWIRHPVYLGYLVAMSGYVIAFPSWRNVIILTAFMVMTWARIWLEERVLDQDATYRAYRRRVPRRLVPRVGVALCHLFLRTKQKPRYADR